MGSLCFASEVPLLPLHMELRLLEKCHILRDDMTPSLDAPCKLCCSFKKSISANVSYLHLIYAVCCVLSNSHLIPAPVSSLPTIFYRCLFFHFFQLLAERYSALIGRCSKVNLFQQKHSAFCYLS